mgnify:CR=1 FL=1
MEKVKLIGEGKPFNSPHGVIYYHSITFESGKIGQFSTKSNPQTKFEVGKEYNVTEEEKSNANGKYIMFNIQKDDLRKGSTQSYYEKPEVQARITAATANRLSIDFFTKKPELPIDFLPKIEMAFVDWILKLGEDPQTQLSRRTALENALLAMSDNRFNITDSSSLFDYAEKVFSKIK